MRPCEASIGYFNGAISNRIDRSFICSRNFGEAAMPSSVRWFDATTTCAPAATSDFALSRASCCARGGPASVLRCRLCALTGSAEAVICAGRSLSDWRTFGEAASPFGPDI